MPAYTEHDDAAYAADGEGPAPRASASSSVSSSPSLSPSVTSTAAAAAAAASRASPTPGQASRRQHSLKKRQFGLYASRLRQEAGPRATTKHDEAASDVEPQAPLRFAHQDYRNHNHDHSPYHNNAAAAAAGAARLRSPRSRTVSPRRQGRFAFVDDFDDSLDDSDYAAYVDNSNVSLPPQLPRPPAPPLSPHSPLLPLSPYSASSAHSSNAFSALASSTSAPTSSPASPASSYLPVSPRWASLANSSTVAYSPYEPAGPGSLDAVAGTPAAFAAAPLPHPASSTVRNSPTPRNRSPAPFQPSSRPPSASPTTSRFPGLSSHPPFVPDSRGGIRSPVGSIRTAASSPIINRWHDAESGIVVPARGTASSAPSITSSPPSSPLGPSGHPGSMPMDNFSRPRKPSIQQRNYDASMGARIRHPSPIQVERSATGPPPLTTKSSWPRELSRGLSLSSTRSTSTPAYVSGPQPRPINDHRNGPGLGGMISPGLPRPPAAYNRSDNSTNAGHGPHVYSAAPASFASLDPPTASSLPFSSSPSSLAAPSPPRIAVDENRSSYRSEWTASTAQNTSSSFLTATGTERSSILTKRSSHTSLSWFTNSGTGADDVSIDDVMGMYEKGFGDSTDAEDDLTDAEDQSVENDYEKSSMDPPAAETTDSLRPPAVTGSGYGGQSSDAPLIVRDSGAFFRNSGLSAALLPAPGGNVPAAADPLHTISIDTASANAAHTGDSALATDSTPRATALGISAAQQASSASPLSPKLSGRAHLNDEVREKRDSAKMLESDDLNTPTQSSPFMAVQAHPQPQQLQQLQQPIESESRPGSSKAPSLYPRAPPAELDDPGLRDRYGFRKQNQYITREQYDAWNGHYTEYIARRRKKWVVYLRDSGLMTENPNRFPPPSVKTKRFIRKGIPPEWRGAAWFYYAGGPSILAKHPGVYDQLIARVNSGEAKEVDIEAIERDLHRTFPDNIKFQFAAEHEPGHDSDSGSNTDSESEKSGGGGAAAHKGPADITADRHDEPEIVSRLRRVLLAFSVYNPRIGYCQSLNFLAGLLLLFVKTEEQCFWLLNVITRIYLPGTHDVSLEGSRVDLSVLMAALQESLPNVWAKISGEMDDGGSAGGHRKVHAGVQDTSVYATLGRRMKLPKVGKAASDSAASTSVDQLPPVTMFLTAWFMSCFIGTFPIETTLRVWDVFFYEGSKTLFRVAMAIFKLGEPELRVADPMEMFGVVQSMPRRMLDCNMVMEATFRRRNGFGHLSQENIDEKRQERRDALKEARKASAAAASNGILPGGGAGGMDMDETDSGLGDVVAVADLHKKATLFGRRRERRPTEVN